MSSVRKYTEEEPKKEESVGAGFYSSQDIAHCDIPLPDSEPKPTDKTDKNKKPKQPPVEPPTPSYSPVPPLKDNSELMSDSDNLEIADDESDWSSAPASPAPLKAPKPFDKKDDSDELPPENDEEDDWSWDAEGFPQQSQPEVPARKPENPPKP